MNPALLISTDAGWSQPFPMCIRSTAAIWLAVSGGALLSELEAEYANRSRPAPTNSVQNSRLLMPPLGVVTGFVATVGGFAGGGTRSRWQCLQTIAAS